MTRISITSAEFDAAHRVAAFQDTVSHICKLEITPEDPGRFSSETTIGVLPNLITGWGAHSASTAVRTTALAAESGDNVMIHAPLSGAYAMQQTGGEAVTCVPGAVYMDPNEVPGTVRFGEERTEAFYVSVPRALLAPATDGLNRALRRLRPVTAEWQLLLSYARSLHEAADRLSPEAMALGAAHVQDLALVALGADRDTAHVAAGRGVRAARLRAVKADIGRNLGAMRLSVGDVARRQGISERYVRALFAAEGTSFRDYVLDCRLVRAHRMLADPARAAQRIAAIAFDAGFGDLSWFNTTFRRRFGATPSEVRAEAFGRRA